MKEAGGELSGTIITLVAIGIIIAAFSVVFWPRIQEIITGMFEGAATIVCPAGTPNAGNRVNSAADCY